MKEVFEAQTLSNYFRFPMIFLCGIFIPLEKMPNVLQYLAKVLPLTYSVDVFRVLMRTRGSIVFEVAVLSLYTVLLITLSVYLLKKNM